MIEADDDPEQDEDDTRPKPAELHCHCAGRNQKRQSYRAADHGPGHPSKVENKASRPNHCLISTSADRKAGVDRSPSTTGRNSAPRYLPYSPASSSMALSNSRRLRRM